MLPSEEYVEQAYLFRALSQRLDENQPIQELIKHLRDEILTTTNLPKAIDFILAELNHAGTMSSAMKRLPHYFTPFQTYLISEAESETGRFDVFMAFVILHHEALYRSESREPQGLFFFQFESLCRNRLNYDRGLKAMAEDPWFNADWRGWILEVRRNLGIIELADFVYLHSEFYLQQQARKRVPDPQVPSPILFGEKEGRIALANRRTEPLYLFAALQRHLSYPTVPRPKRRDENADLVPKLQRLCERLEVRVKLLEDEQREKGIDLSQFYQRPGENL